VGDGEVLLELDLFGRVLDAGKSSGFLVNASTNGLLLSENVCQTLVEGKLHDLNISLDAASPEIYRQIRGADLNKVLKNIEILNKIKRDQHSPIPNLHLSMVGMTRNIHELPDLVKLAAEYSAVSVTLQAMGEVGPVINESIFLRDKARGKKYFLESQQLGESSNVSVDLWPPDQFETRQETKTKPDDYLLKDCEFPWDVPYFATDGTVRSCCAMPPLGDLNQHSFEEIWNGKPYQNLRKQIKTKSPPQECIICPGRGWYNPTHCKSELIIGRDDRQLGTGWFEQEKNESGPFRWARPQATFFLNKSDADILMLEIGTGYDPGTTQTIEVEIDRLVRWEVNFDLGSFREIYLPMPDSGKSLHVVKISGKGWKPLRTVPGEKDPRQLLVRFHRAKLLSPSHQAMFEENIQLKRCEFPAQTDRNNAKIPLTLIWKTPDSFEPGIRVFVHVFYNPKNIAKKSFILDEVMKRITGSRGLFQTDVDIPSQDHGSELVKMEIMVPVPEKVSAGSYQFLVGLYRKDKGRFRIIDTLNPTYRNGIILPPFELL